MTDTPSAGNPASGTTYECGYHERDRHCREPAPYEVQFDGRKHWFCERHIRPEFHSPDLRKKLPGPVKRAMRRLA